MLGRRCCTVASALSGYSWEPKGPLAVTHLRHAGRWSSDGAAVLPEVDVVAETLPLDRELKGRRTLRME
jgi:hypothetical protein